jgi:Zn-dependent protease with chaperone function
MNRCRCLAGIAASYLPLVACGAVIAAICAWAGDLRTAIWLLVATIIGYGFMYMTIGRGRMTYSGVRVTSESQPALMAVVDSVVSRASIRHLDGVWLDAGANAQAILGRRDWLGRRHLGIVIGLLAAAHLSAEELTAILAHEAGHLTDSDRLRHFLGSRRSYAITKLERRTARPLWWYWRWFLTTTRELGLSIERRADAVSVQMCGAEIAQRAQYREMEAVVVHAIAMQGFVEPLWRARIAPASLFELYQQVWTQLAADVAAGVEASMSASARPEDTHPGLAERCGGRHFAPAPALSADPQLPSLAELDRRCTAQLTQRRCNYVMERQRWSEITPEVLQAARAAAS